MLSFANTLTFQILKGRPIKKLFFFWSVRDDRLPAALDSRDGHLLKMAHLNRIPGSDPAVFTTLSPIIDLRIHVTRPSGPGRARDEQEADGRPSYRLIESKMTVEGYLEEVKRYADGNAPAKVSVLCCGPETLNAVVSRKCKQLKFDHHIENFTL